MHAYVSVSVVNLFTRRRRLRSRLAGMTKRVRYPRAVLAPERWFGYLDLANSTSSRWQCLKASYSNSCVSYDSAAFTLCCAVLSTTELRADAAPFTVAREIGIAQFQSYSGSADGFVQFSPNGEYLAAYVERGLVSADRVQGSLRIYRTRTCGRFLRGDPTQSLPRLGGRSRRRNTRAEIGSWRWMADSAGIAFCNVSLPLPVS